MLALRARPDGASSSSPLHPSPPRPHDPPLPPSRLWQVVSLVAPGEEALLGVITRQLGVSIKQDRALLRRLAAAEGEEGEAAAAL